MEEVHRYQVNINAVPESFGLVKAKQLILEKLDDRNAIEKLAYFRNSDQSAKKSVIVVHLKTAEDVAKLLQSAKIEVEFNDSLHTLLLTRPRISSISQAPSQPASTEALPGDKSPSYSLSGRASRSPPRERSNPDLYHRNEQQDTEIVSTEAPPGDGRRSYSKPDHPLRSRSKVRSYPDLHHRNETNTERQGTEREDGPSNVTSKQRSLYVTRIPPHMYDEKILREHFERFGYLVRCFVPRNRPTRFAIIEYDDHSSAARALQLAPDLRPYETNLQIVWDAREAERLAGGPSGPAGPSRNFPSARRARGRTPIRRIQTEGAFHARGPQVVAEEPVSWSTMCMRESEWFRAPGGRSLLVQDIPLYIDNQKLGFYFENISGGSVKRMVPLVDGVLIEFANKTSVDNIFKQTCHVIDSAPLRLFRKPIPLLCKDRFMITGAFRNVDAVQTLLKCCDDSVEFTVTKHDEPNTFFVKCGRSLDIKRLANVLARAALDVKAMVHELCRTDCILVEGLQRSVSDDVIKLEFMNRKKTNGGDVTAVKRNMNGDKAVVYFANFRDAENVVQRSRQSGITVDGDEVEVSLYHGGLGMMVRRGPTRNAKNRNRRKAQGGPKNKASPKERGIHQFDYVPECDNDVIEYIVRSSDCYTELRNNLSKVAQLDFNNKTPSTPGTPMCWVAKFKPVAKQKMEKSYQNDQGAFESGCTSILVAYLSQFVTESCELNADKLKRIRQAYMWNEESDLILAEISATDEPYPAFIRWNTLREGTKVTGLPHHVTSIIDWLKQCCDHSTADERYSKEEFQILIECDVIGDVKDNHRGKIEIKVEEEFRTLKFKGQTDAVAQAKLEIASKLKRMKGSDMPFLDETQLTFLREVLANPDSDVEKQIKQEFHSDNIKAVLRLSPNPVLLHSQRQDLTKAMQLLTNLIATETIDAKGKYDKVVQNQDWKRLEQSINSGNCRLYKDKRAGEITVVGFASPVGNACCQIYEHMNDNVEKKKTVELQHLYVLFLSHFPKESEADTRLKDVQWQISSTQREVSLKGKAVDVSKAVQWLQQENNSVITSSEVVGKPGMAEYFRGKTGKQFLQTTQTVSKCVINLGLATASSSPSSQVGRNATSAKEGMNERTQQAEPLEMLLDLNEGFLETQSAAVQSVVSPVCQMFKKLTQSPSYNAQPSVPIVGVTSPQISIVRRNIASHKMFKKLTQSPSYNAQPSIPNVGLTSPQISIVQGNIASHKADVIVTCNTPDHFVSGQGSSISAALLRKAGAQLQASCQQLAAYTQLTSGSVLQTPGFGVGCQEIYHILLRKRVESKLFPNVIKKCLNMAERSGYSRIAFPAIATGGMGYLGSLVASSLKTEVSNFKGVHLRNVDIVLDPGNQAIINEFNKVFSSNYQATGQTSSSVFPTVSVQQGDISKSSCDVIVNTTTEQFQLTNSPLSQLIVGKAGQSIIAECQQTPTYSGNNFRVTSGGNLNCKYLVHVVPPGNANALIPILTNVLTLIEGMKLNSIAIPAIGTGKAGLSSAHVAQAMQAAFQSVQATNPRHLKKIEVVIFDANIIQDFQQNISTGPTYTAQTHTAQTLPKPAPKPAPKPKPRRTFKIPAESQASSSDQVEILFCSKEQKNIDEARRRIGDHVKEKSLRKTKDVDIISFGQEVEDEVMGLEQKHNVVVRRAQTTGTSIQLAISGLRDEVMEAYTSATELIQKYKEALTCAEYVVWKYQDPRTTVLSDFPLTISLQIETTYKKNPQGTLTVTVLIGGKKRRFSIDFASMTETSLENNYSTKIVRSQKSSGENFPPEWEDIGDKPFKNFIVAPNSQEYQKILGIFKATGSIRQPVSLKRVQNPTLYNQFQAQKRKVEARMKAKGSTLPVTRQLFHGTSQDVCESIYKDGFDRSHCGRNATAFGKGVYFATTCQYSQGFAHADSQGCHRMFLAEVITGEFHQGDSSLKTPNFMNVNKKERYDSVVNQMNSPAMFVVFKDASVYPAYILKYK